MTIILRSLDGLTKAIEMPYSPSIEFRTYLNERIRITDTVPMPVTAITKIRRYMYEGESMGGVRVFEEQWN